MQITVKSSKVLKRGTNNYGEWALIKVITDKDVEYTTLHKEAERIEAGMVIDIDQLSILEKDGKEKRSFKKFDIVSGAKPATAKTNGGREGMSPELWAEKDRLDRASMESMSAYRGIIELASKGFGTKEIKDAQEVALAWAVSRLSVPKASAPKVSPIEAKTKDIDELFGAETLQFNNPGEFYAACLKHFKLPKSKVDAEIVGLDLTNSAQRQQAFANIQALYGVKE